MSRFMLRTGYRIESTATGGRLVHQRTGDALVLPREVVSLFIEAEQVGAQATSPDDYAIATHFAAMGFLVETGSLVGDLGPVNAGVPDDFYELSLEDAPRTGETAVPALTAPRPSPQPAPLPQPIPAPRSAPASSPAPAPTSAAPLDVLPTGAFELAPPVASSASNEALALDAAGWPLSQQEAHLRDVLRSQMELDASSAPLSQQETHLRDALRAEQVAPAAAAEPPPAPLARIDLVRQPQLPLEAAALEPAAPLAPVPATAPAPSRQPAQTQPVAAGRPSPAKPLMMVLGGVLVLTVGVVVTFAMRGEDGPDAPPASLDAGTALVEPPVNDAGAPALVAIAPALDAGPAPGPVVSPPIDAGPALTQGEWLEVEVQSRGRVTMTQVTAPASGVVAWTVRPQERVSSKSQLGRLTTSDGTALKLPAGNVGLAMLKVADGATVTSGELLADIIYFEAYAKGFVTGTVPTAAWRCEVSSARAKQSTPCKVTGVVPRKGGAQVTVVIEPLWFDAATDVALRVAPR